MMSTRRAHGGARIFERMRRISLTMLLRSVFLIGFAVAAVWLSIAVGAASLFRSSRPDIALDFLPADARARAAAAEMRVQQSGAPPDAQQTQQLLRQSLQRDPTVVPAWRTLGLLAAASGNLTEAARYFRTAERMSRRDVVTQLWLIEERVRNDDVAGALHHYDIALRTSRGVQDVLIPVLVSATAVPDVTDPLARTLAVEPSWAAVYYRALLRPPSTGAGGAALAETLRRLSPGIDLSELRGLPALLAENHAYEEAARAYQAVVGPVASDRLVRNGGFERANIIPAFDWELSQDGDVYAELGPVDGAEGAALRVHARNGVSGTAARQLLILEPGSYRLRFVAGMNEGPAPELLAWRLTCAGENGAMLFDKNLASAEPERKIHVLTFRVPPDCPAQWLRLETVAKDSPAGSEVWVDSVAIESRSS